MKNHKKALILLLTLMSSVSVARGKHRKRQEKVSKPYKYYFTLPTLPAETSLAEWAYAIPECQSVSKDEYKYVDRKENCQENAEFKTKTCLSRIDVELKNLKTNEKKKFGLNYLIYDTMKACEEAHAKSVAPAEPEKKN